MKWVQGWRERALQAAGIPTTQFALDVLSAWQKSTPTMPWTNNPLGMPAHGTGYPRALDTPYAVFPSINHFATAFGKWMKANTGLNVQAQLTSANSTASAWREIHALNWPANTTETEYPAALLDMVEQAYREKMAGVGTGKRKSAGTQVAPPVVHDAVKAQAAALHEAATAFHGGSAGIRAIVRRLG